MAPPLLFLKDIHLGFGGTPVLDGAELSVSGGERLCLVGRNGSGKSTLLKIAAGLIEPDNGERFLQPGTTVAYLPQEPDLSGFARTEEYVRAALPEGTDPHRARLLLEHLGLTGLENPAELSGGEARRAGLARILAPEPDILFLDEPTNHLDLPAIEWLEAALGRTSAAIVLISHDRRFLNTLSRSTLWLDRGQARQLDRGFAYFEEWRDQVLAEEERDRHKLDRKLVAEADWLRYGVTGRRKRNQGRLRALEALRQERRDQIRRVGTATIEAAAAPTSGRMVIEAERIAKSFDGVPIVRDLSIRVQRGDRIGIIGANGSGKTTLLRLLTGDLTPDSGMVRIGQSVRLISLDQRRQSLDPGQTLTQALTRGGGDTVMVGGQPRHVASYMKDFLFRPEQAQTRVSALSGGERGRLMLARALSEPSNLLVLDEPTNDLDVETLDLLQEMLADYDGTVLLVSHDRDFLDRVAASVLVSEGNGRWAEYAGGYSDMLAQRGQGVSPRQKTGSPAPARATRPRPEATAQAPARRKLSFKDRHALETLPAAIERLNARIAGLEARLADGDLYRRDPAAFQNLSAELGSAAAERTDAEDRWLALELLREEIEAGPA